MAPAPDGDAPVTTPSPLQRLRAYRPGALATGALLATVLQLLRVGCQAAAVILLARALGPHDYGALVGVSGLGMITGTLSWLGGSYLLLEQVAREPQAFGRAWSATRHSVFVLAALLLLAFLPLAPLLLRLPLDPLLLLALGVSEILCYPLVYAGGFAFQAHERQGWANGLPALMSVVRLLAALAFLLLVPQPTLAGYALFHLAASLLCAALSLLAVQRLLAPAPEKGRYGTADLRRGAGYLAGGLSLNAYNEGDKILAVRALGAGPAGAYAIAYRVISMLAMPALSLAQVAQPRMFRHAQAGERRALRALVLKVALAGLAYTALAAALVWMLAPLLTPLLGAAFAPAVDATRALVLLLPLMCLRLLAVTLMTSLGRPALRAGVEAVAIGVLVLAVGLLAPRHGLGGVIAAVLGVEALLFVLLATLAARLIRERQPVPQNGR